MVWAGHLAHVGLEDSQFQVFADAVTAETVVAVVDAENLAAWLLGCADLALGAQHRGFVQVVQGLEGRDIGGVRAWTWLRNEKVRGRGD